MGRPQRRYEITNYINEHGTVTFQELKNRFPDVSDMTLRTDLRELGDMGKIIRIWGGARSVQETAKADDSYFMRLARSVEKRQQIARKAASFLKEQLDLKPNVCIYLDCGVTITEIAKCFPDEWCTVVTNSISNAYALAALKRPSVTVLGGALNRYNCCCDSSRNIEDLKRMNFDFMFLATAGYSIDVGFTCGKEVIDDVREVIMEHSRKIIIPFDSSKIGLIYPITHTMPEDIDMVIADDGFPDEVIQHLQARGVEVM